MHAAAEVQAGGMGNLDIQTLFPLGRFMLW